MSGNNERLEKLFIGFYEETANRYIVGNCRSVMQSDILKFEYKLGYPHGWQFKDREDFTMLLKEMLNDTISSGKMDCKRVAKEVQTFMEAHGLSKEPRVKHLVKKLMDEYDRQQCRKCLFILNTGDPSGYHDTICLQDSQQAGEWFLITESLTPGKEMKDKKTIRIQNRSELENYLNSFVRENYEIIFEGRRI